MNFAQPPPPPTVNEEIDTSPPTVNGEIDTLLAALSTGLNGTQSLRRDIAALRKKTTEKEPTLGILGRPMFFEVGDDVSLSCRAWWENMSNFSSILLFFFSFPFLSFLCLFSLHYN